MYYTAGQPFVQSPFIGGIGPNFGLGPGFIGTQFGFPGFATAIGTPVGGNGNFGSASSYPGMGSVVGSILPGLVLATTTLPCTALTGNCRPPGLPGTAEPDCGAGHLYGGAFVLAGCSVHQSIVWPVVIQHVCGGRQVAHDES